MGALLQQGLLPVVLGFLFLLYSLTISESVDPMQYSPCIAYESTYHVRKGCKCVTFESLGRSNGVFKSPDFPSPYPPGMNCVLLTFIGDAEEIVELNFLEFDLPEERHGRCRDFLKLFLDLDRAEVSDDDQETETLCGQITHIQKTFYSSKRSLILEFHSEPDDNFSRKHKGFKGRFSFKPNNEYISDGVPRWGGPECGYDFNSDVLSPLSGRFFSEKYPQNYPSNSHCYYFFYGNTTQRVHVVFSIIQLEHTRRSCDESPDVIIVHDGKDADAEIIAHYCNTMNNVEVISKGQHLLIEFISNYQNERQGFAATYTFVQASNASYFPSTLAPRHRPYDPPTAYPRAITPTTNSAQSDCDETIRSIEIRAGTITSPGYPNNYQAGLRCVYTLIGRENERVQLNFTQLDVYNPKGDMRNCGNDDLLTVYNIVDGSREQLSELCESPTSQGVNEAVFHLMSSGNKLVVEFKSTEISQTAPGFVASFAFVTNYGIYSGVQVNNKDCIFRYNSDTATTGVFTSPNHPGLYPQSTNCHYLFSGRSNEIVEIQFQKFQVEGVYPRCNEEHLSDYVEFSNFDIGQRDGKFSRYCDDEKKSLQSDSKFLRVSFHSNNMYDEIGFYGTYKFIPVKDDAHTDKFLESPNSASQIKLCLLWPVFVCLKFML